jgi:hypothetical protein
METTLKSPNRLWRDSGTSLSFADWIQREKDKNNFLINKKFENFANVQGESNDTDWLESAKQESRDFFGIDKPSQPKKDNTFIGLNKGVILISVLLIAGAIGYKIYQKRK